MRRVQLDTSRRTHGVLRSGYRPAAFDRESDQQFGPRGSGSAWLSAEPNALGMQIGGVRATIGDEGVLLRRNGFRLRRRRRVIRVEGSTRRWSMTFPTARSAQITDDADDKVLWRRDGAVRTGDPTLLAVDVAMLVLLDHVSLESTAGGPMRILRNL